MKNPKTNYFWDSTPPLGDRQIYKEARHSWYSVMNDVIEQWWDGLAEELETDIESQ